jgi:formate dehydrogenase subunit gamma
MGSGEPARGLVPRYARAQRAVHWVGVASFALLLASGSVLVFRSLAFLAAGGYAGLLHRIAAIPFLALPAVYALLLPGEARALLRESLAYTREDRRWLARLPAYLLGRTRGLPPQGRLNAGQKLHHAGTFLLFVAVSASGLVLWLGKGALGASGLAWAATVHDLSVLGLSLLSIGHVYFTFVYGALSAMRTGYVTEEYARDEHRAWFETLPRRDLPAPGGAAPTAPERETR